LVLLINLQRDAVRYIKIDANTQTFHGLEELTPLHRLIPFLDLAEKVFAKTDTACRVVLTKPLSLSGSPDNLADIRCTAEWYLHFNPPVCEDYCISWEFCVEIRKVAQIYSFAQE